MQFTLKTTIEASADAIYTAWLSSEGHAAMTGGAASISNNIGDTFIAWDGYISGRTLDLEANKRILQSWRTTDFTDDEEDSRVEVLLNEQNGSTELTLIHSNLSDSGEQYKQGWKEHYFEPMREHFNLLNR